jgi:hypothetical protein
MRCDHNYGYEWLLLASGQDYLGITCISAALGGSGRSEGERRGAVLVEQRVYPRARTSGELPMHRQRMACDLCMMYTVASTERLTAAMKRLQGLVASACTSARPRSALGRM